jgi:mannose-6-phosphate isomerase
LASAVQWLLQLEAGEAGGFADEIVEQAKQLQAVPASERFGREIEWTVKIGTGFPGDIGVVVGLLLNHVSLLPGQAMFLEAGNLHSYLQGTGIELMANSDNVLRGGLTPKHVDVDELLAVVQYAPSAAPVQTPDGPVHRFESPVPEFNLTRLGPSATGQSFGTAPFGPDGPSIVLLTGGQVSLETGSQTLALGAGDTAFVTAADGPFRLVDGDPGVTTAWVATVGDGR